MKTSDVYGGDYLKAEHIGDKKPVVTISKADVETFERDNGKTEKKIVLSFEGKDKRFVVNTTNAAIISENLGSDDTDNWLGRKIALCVKKVEFAGKLVPAIRVVLNDAPAVPVKAAPKPSPATAPCDEEGQLTEPDDVGF